MDDVHAPEVKAINPVEYVPAPALTRRRGRPSKCSPAQVASVLERLGNVQAVASELGISRSTVDAKLRAARGGPPRVKRGRPSVIVTLAPPEMVGTKVLFDRLWKDSAALSVKLAALQGEVRSVGATAEALKVRLAGLFQ